MRRTDLQNIIYRGWHVVSTRNTMIVYYHYTIISLLFTPSHGSRDWPAPTSITWWIENARARAFIGHLYARYVSAIIIWCAPSTHAQWFELVCYWFCHTPAHNHVRVIVTWIQMSCLFEGWCCLICSSSSHSLTPRWFGTASQMWLLTKGRCDQC